MEKDKAFDSVAELAEARAKAKPAAASAVRKAKAGGGISAAAPAVAKHVVAAYGDGGEAGLRRAYLAMGCVAKALAEGGAGVFDLAERDGGPTLAQEEKRALYEEVKLLLDDRLEPVVGAALSIGEFHLEPHNVSGLVGELGKPGSISSSLLLLGPAAMGMIKPKAKPKATKIK